MARAPAALRRVAARALLTLRSVGVPGPGTALAVAVSGGADSLALLHTLRTLAGRRDWKLVVLTVDHGLRPGSRADADFVVAHALALGLPARLLVAPPGAVAARRPGQGVEAAARAVRYELLERAADEEGCELIATGHTADDQAETVLLQLLRGSGPGGLAGMAVRSGRLLRPLLRVTRAEARACCEAVGVAWREDPTNADPRFLRNALRLRVLPLLEELRPGATRTLARHAELAADERAWLAELTARALERLAVAPGAGGPGVALDAPRLAAQPVALARRVVRAAAAAAGQPPPGAADVEEVLALARAGREGGEHRWPGGGCARRQGPLLVLPGPR